MSKFKISIKPIVLSVCTAFALFCISHISVNAQTKHSVQSSYAAMERKLDQIAGKFYPGNQPGATVIVAKGGQVLLKKGYGLANVEKKEKMMPDHVLRLGSITKQFTAVAIMMLVEEGKVNLNDPVTKFIPDYPETGRKVTIEHLLTHTSGVPSYTRKPGFFEQSMLDRTLTEMIDSFKNDPLVFEPGSVWSYSNSGYILLGAIIEKVSGISYAKFVEQRIFQPLGMKHTAYEGYERSQYVKATGYSHGSKGFFLSPRPNMTQAYAAGAIASNVGDMFVWNRAAKQGKLLKKETWQKILTSHKLANGAETDYGYGWIIGKIQSRLALAHDGEINGFSTYTAYLPESEVFVAVLTNADNGLATPEAVGTRLAAAAIGHDIPEFNAIKLDEATLDQYVGVYKINEDARRIVTRDGDKLVMKRTDGARTELHAYSQNEFFRDNNSILRVVFNKDSNGDVLDMTVYQQGSSTKHPKLNEALPSLEKSYSMSIQSFDMYVGEYQITPDFFVTVRREGNKFIGQATDQPSVELLPISENQFKVPSFDAELEFEKGQDGAVTHLKLIQGGREMLGKKIK